MTDYKLELDQILLPEYFMETEGIEIKNDERPEEKSPNMVTVQRGWNEWIAGQMAQMKHWNVERYIGRKFRYLSQLVKEHMPVGLRKSEGNTGSSSILANTTEHQVDINKAVSVVHHVRICLGKWIKFRLLYIAKALVTHRHKKTLCAQNKLVSGHFMPRPIMTPALAPST